MVGKGLSKSGRAISSSHVYFSYINSFHLFLLLYKNYVILIFKIFLMNFNYILFSLRFLKVKLKNLQFMYVSTNFNDQIKLTFNDHKVTRISENWVTRMLSIYHLKILENILSTNYLQFSFLFLCMHNLPEPFLRPKD